MSKKQKDQVLASTAESQNREAYSPGMRIHTESVEAVARKNRRKSEIISFSFISSLPAL
jgi:hypothetical protein